MPLRVNAGTLSDARHWTRHFFRYCTYFLFGAVGLVTFAPYLPTSKWPRTLNVIGPSMAPLLSARYKETGIPDQLKILPKPAIDLYPDEKINDDEKKSSLHPLRDRGRRSNALKLCRGQLVAYRSPNDPEREVIKRVIAVEGDIVTPRRDHWHIWRKAAQGNGSPLLVIEIVEKPGPVADQRTPSGCAYGPSRRGPVLSDAERKIDQKMHVDAEDLETIKVTVPFGHVWVEGENAAESLDSNYYGPVSKRLITGIACNPYKSSQFREPVKWEHDGWQDRWRGRVEWKFREGIVPFEWTIYN